MDWPLLAANFVTTATLCMATWIKSKKDAAKTVAQPPDDAIAMKAIARTERVEQMHDSMAEELHDNMERQFADMHAKYDSLRTDLFKDIAQIRKEVRPTEGRMRTENVVRDVAELKDDFARYSSEFDRIVGQLQGSGHLPYVSQPMLRRASRPSGEGGE